MPMNPTLTQMVVESWITDMQRPAVVGGDGFHHAGARPSHTGSQWVCSAAAATRRTIGWFIVGVGLRLAVSRPRPATAR